MAEPPALIVAGPTASGKSTLALALAQSLGGTVVNADSMQVYAELRVLTARPTPAEEALVPHRLYGVRPAAQPGSVAWWRAAALDAMARAHATGSLPILCGGTGLYLTSLTTGLSDIPAPGEAARTEARALLAALGPAGLHARLTQADPHTAARLRPSDSQRLARAWEVFASTGQGLTSWQSRREPPAPWRFRAILLDPPRTELRDAIARRFAAMLAAGARDEVHGLLAQGLDPALPAMRAHGVPELAAHLRGEITLPEAQARAERATRAYTRRQATWFRHRRMADPGNTHVIHARIDTSAQFSQSDWRDLQHFVLRAG